jgi:hypothetical protein
MSHLTNYIKHQDLQSDNTLHVIGVISNPVRYQSRYRLFEQWASEMLATPNVKLYVVEACYGDRWPEVAPFKDEYSYLSVRTRLEIWLKENLLNLGVKRLLPNDWSYMAWVDCDVTFRNPNWALDSIHQLQAYDIIQPWADAVDLCHDGGIHKHFKSFGYFDAKEIKQAASSKNIYNYQYGHTGFAWACTREFYENVEKLLDFAILGAGDAHMAYASVGRVMDTVNGRMNPGYKAACLDWQIKALKGCGGRVGYTPGRIEHHFHGPKTRRQYADRWQILIKHKYDPYHDLRFDRQGVLRLKGKHGLERDIMRYNRERFEDSIEQY